MVPWKFVGKFFNFDYFLVFFVPIHNFINTLVINILINCCVYTELDHQNLLDILVKLVILKQCLKLVLLLQVFNTFWEVLELASQYVRFFTLFSRLVADLKVEF